MTRHASRSDAGPSEAKTLRALYDEHGASLYRYLVGMLEHADDAEDVLQTVWTKLCRRLHRVETPALYLWRAARNEALRHLRRRGRRTRHEVAEADLEMLPVSVNPGVSREERLALVKALRSLPFKQREAVVLIAFEGLTAHEAGDRLGTSESTAASRYRLALEKLRRKLQST